MTYATGAITSNATPATALIAQIESTLTAHAAWAFVEEYVAGAITYRIWRNLGTANGFGQDWFLILSRATVGTGVVSIQCAEQYDAVTHAHNHPCPAEPQVISSTNGPIPDVDFAYPGGPWPLTGTAGYLPGQDRLFFVSHTTSTTAMDYWYTVTNSTFIIATRVVSTVVSTYVGLFDSLLSGGAPDPFPLVIFRPEQTQSATVSAGSFSRMPRQQLNVPHQFAMHDHASTSNYFWNQPAAVTVVGGAAAVASDQYQQDRPVASRALVVARRGIDGAAPAEVGFARGLLKNLVVLNQTGVIVGDTVTIGADTYVYLGQRLHWMNASAT